jgi:hypothetical protein
VKLRFNFFFLRFNFVKLDFVHTATKFHKNKTSIRPIEIKTYTRFSLLWLFAIDYWLFFRKGCRPTEQVA